MRENMKRFIFIAMMMLNVINIFAQETIASVDLDAMKKMRSDKYVYLSSSSARTTCDFGLLTGIAYKEYMMRTVDLNDDTTYIRVDMMIKDYEWLNLKFNKESYLNFAFINKQTNEKVNVKVNFAENIKLEDMDIDVPDGFKVVSGAFLLNDQWKMMYDYIDGKDYHYSVDCISFYDNFQLYEYIDDVILDRAEEIKKEFEEFENYETIVEK